jgi:hypothetical protein
MLLQLKKATLNDIKDICWALSRSQIRELLNLYVVAD